MKLPNYFLADLPVEALVTPLLISDACHALRRNRARYMVDRTTAQMVKSISKIAAEWLVKDYPIRLETLLHGPSQTGFSLEVLTQGLDDYFSGITEQSLFGLIEQDLGHRERLDGMVTHGGEQSRLCAAMTNGPELMGHLTGGVLPNSTFTNIFLGLLLRSSQFVKCAQGTSFLPRMLAHSIYHTDHKLGACLEIAEWKGGTRSLEDALFQQLDCLTVTGSSETITNLRRTIPARLKLVGHGHQMSVGYIAAEVMTLQDTRELVRRVVYDVSAWDQLGCLSPQVIYVEKNGSVSPTMFAEFLAEELRTNESRIPRAPLEIAMSAKIASLRGFYEVRSVTGSTQIWSSQGSTSWTVVYDPDSDVHPSCQHRFIFVKPIEGLEQMLQNLDPFRGQLSTVGLAVSSSKIQNAAQILARWGVTRICPLGQMQRPPISWRHDGQPALGELVTWTNLEY